MKKDKDLQKEMQEKMDHLRWVLDNMPVFEAKEQMEVIATMLAASDRLEVYYKKYKGKVFFMR